MYRYSMGVYQAAHFSSSEMSRREIVRLTWTLSTKRNRCCLLRSVGLDRVVLSVRIPSRTPTFQEEEEEARRESRLRSVSTVEAVLTDCSSGGISLFLDLFMSSVPDMSISGRWHFGSRSIISDALSAILVWVVLALTIMVTKSSRD